MVKASLDSTSGAKGEWRVSGWLAISNAREKKLYFLLYRYWWNTRIFPLLKNHIFMARSEVLFLSFTCEDIGVAMVTNMISQLQESFPLRHAAGSFEISFTKWPRGAKTAQLPVTFSVSCQIFTSILFPSSKNIQEDYFAIGDHFNCTILLFRKWI